MGYTKPSQTKPDQAEATKPETAYQGGRVAETTKPQESRMDSMTLARSRSISSSRCCSVAASSLYRLSH